MHFFFGLLAIYFYLSNKFILSAFIFSTIFFLKQTQGIWFLSIFACLLFRDYLLKTINFKILLYFAFGVIINLFIIFLFYDLSTYYNNSVKFITQYTDSLYEVNYNFYKKFILQFFKIQLDQHIVFSSSFKSKGIISFYFCLFYHFIF